MFSLSDCVRRFKIRPLHCNAQLFSRDAIERERERYLFKTFVNNIAHQIKAENAECFKVARKRNKILNELATFLHN